MPSSAPPLLRSSAASSAPVPPAHQGLGHPRETVDAHPIQVSLSVNDPGCYSCSCCSCSCPCCSCFCSCRCCCCHCRRRRRRCCCCCCKVAGAPRETVDGYPNQAFLSTDDLLGKMFVGGCGPARSRGIAPHAAGQASWRNNRRGSSEQTVERGGGVGGGGGGGRGGGGGTCCFCCCSCSCSCSGCFCFCFCFFTKVATTSTDCNRQSNAFIHR